MPPKYPNPLQKVKSNCHNKQKKLKNEISLFILVKSALPGVYLSEHVNTLPCLQEVSIPQRSLTNTVSLTGLQEKMVVYTYVKSLLGEFIIHLE